MIPELSILKLLLNYTNWNENHHEISIEDFPKELQPIFSSIDNYHASNSAHSDLSADDLANLVFSIPHKDRDFVQGILEQVDQCQASNETTHQLLRSIRQRNLLKKISITSYEVSEGRAQPSNFETLLESYTKFSNQQQSTTSNGTADGSLFITDDLTTLISDSITTPGLRWRLNTLNQMLGSLRKGDFGFVFARPETGKTTFLASEVTYMAEQLTEASGPILWVNNEEQGSKVMLRCYQAALGVDLTVLYSNIDQHKARFNHLTHNKIKIYDSGVVHKKAVEKLAAELKPSLIIFDQIGKITGFDNDREDLRQGAIYQWARELAKQYCPVIGVCQADGTGEGQRWLTMSNVADAKTSKQAEADWILGIGRVNDVGYDNLRFLHLSKNKLVGDTDTIPDQRHGKREVLIDASIARYKDIG